MRFVSGIKRHSIDIDEKLRAKFVAHRPSIIRQHPEMHISSDAEHVFKEIQRYDRHVIRLLQLPIYSSPARTGYRIVEKSYDGASQGVKWLYASARKVYRWRP